MKLIEDLKYRGLIDNYSNEEIFDKLDNEKINFYIGTDPTADSLHIGHYCSVILTARRLQKFGHNATVLIGGGTGLIGDPKPDSERPIITKEQLNINYEGLRSQIQDKYGFNVVNNYDWLKDINFIDYLRDYGKYFNLNYMLNKETVKSRLGTGITYTEFSYMIMQSMDYMHLFQNNNITLQIGGSDQWGNILSGVELIRKKLGNEVYAFTMPLITKKDGKKFGKSETGTLWLDKEKTSSYELFQYFINVEDEMVIEYLRKLTFLEKEEIEKLEISLKNEPHLRIPHKRLAQELITDIHDYKEYESALKISEAMFSGNIKDLTKTELKNACKGLPIITITTNINLLDLLVENKIVNSKREGREFVLNGAISINGEKIVDLEFNINKDISIHDEYIVIRKGKKNYYLVKFEG